MIKVKSHEPKKSKQSNLSDRLEDLNEEIEEELVRLHERDFDEIEEEEEDLTDQTAKINFEFTMTWLLIGIVIVNILYIIYRIVGMIF